MAALQTVNWSGLTTGEDQRIPMFASPLKGGVECARVVEGLFEYVPCTQEAWDRQG